MSSEWALFRGYIYSSIFAAVPISYMMYLLSENIKNIGFFENRDFSKSPKKMMPKELTFDGYILSQWQVIIVGIIERFLYLTSIMVGKPEFIAAWLAIKTVYTGLSERDVSGKRIYNNFLVGNGISILYAFAGVGIIQWVTGSFLPSETSKKLPILNQSISLAWASAITPIVLSLLFICFLRFVRSRIYKEFNDPSR